MTRTRESACAHLGIPDHELLEVLPSPAGDLFRISDGTTLIEVPADRPDADGKVGLMFAEPPAHPGGYKGDFPIYANTPTATATTARDLGIVAEVVAAVAEADPTHLDKHELAELARDLGIEDATAKWSKARLLEAIAAARSAATPAQAADAADESPATQGEPADEHRDDIP